MDTEDGMDVEARMQLQSVIDAIAPAARLEVAMLPRNDLIRLHHGLGTLIRNRIRAGELGALVRWSRDQTGAEARSFDDLSWPILVAVWTALRPSPDE